MVYFKKKSKQTNFLNTSLKENSPFWDSQLTVGEVLVLKKFKKLFSVGCDGTHGAQAAKARSSKV